MNTVNSPSSTPALMLEKTLRCSRYAKRILEADKSLLQWLQENHATPCSHAEMLVLLQQTGLDLADEAQLTRAVRILRKQVMVKLILRDLNGLANLAEVMQAMTALAEVCVQLVLACLMPVLQEQFGRPLGSTSARPQELLVLGMGKLGGGELNVSSDIDLIFVYAEDGETAGPRKLGNNEFFTRLGRRLINIINEQTADGYVFRVDMRLRPYGESGPLVMNFDALEEYLLTQGREWERYAWIKARVIAPAQKPARLPLPNPLGETTSHSTKLPKSAAKSLVIPQAGRAKRGGRSRTNESLREFQIIEQTRADIAYAVQEAIVDVLAHKARAALAQTGLNQLVVAGGVGANQLLRSHLTEDIEKRGGKVFYPDMEFCTDNGAMIAFAGALRLQQNDAKRDYRFNVKPRWDLQDINVAT